MGYTWDDIIIDPTSDKAKNAIGKEVYYANNPMSCLSAANAGIHHYKVLQSLDLREIYPFYVDGNYYECIIVKTASAYKQHQAEWVEDHGIKEGSYVKVLRRAEEHESDWGDTWLPEMDNFVDTVCKVTQVCPNGIELESDYIFPYYVLKKISDKYDPFNSAEEFIARYSFLFKKDPDMLTSAIWVKNTCDIYCLVTEIVDDGVVLGNGEYMTYWEDLLEDWVFMNGTPCGKPKATTGDCA